MSQDIQSLLPELKRLAEAVGGSEWFDDTGVGTFEGAHVWGADGDAVCRCFNNIGHMPEPVDELDVAAFIAKANPATVLSLVAHIEELERQLAELRQVQEWQPIETAPKDRTQMLLAVIYGGQVFDVANGHFEVLAEDEDDGPWDIRDGEPWCSYEGRAAGTYFCHWLPGMEFDPSWRVTDDFPYTHWMLRPAAPSAGQAKQSAAAMVCPKCGVDRSKDPCPDLQACGFAGTAYQSAAPGQNWQLREGDQFAAAGKERL